MSICEDYVYGIGIEDELIAPSPVVVDELKDKPSQLLDSLKTMRDSPANIDFIFNDFNTFKDRSKVVPKHIYRPEDLVESSEYNLLQKHVKQLEQWTGLKCGEVVFDSDLNNWNKNNCDLNSKIIGRKQLVFLIEDENGEKFGYYLNTKMIRNYMKNKPADWKSFQFNIESNGRLATMEKYEIKDIYSGGYKMNRETEEMLITLGDIVLMKKERKNKSLCYNDKKKSFDFDDEKYVMTGRKHFCVERLVVIQME